MTGHDAEFGGHNAETGGHDAPKYAFGACLLVVPLRPVRLRVYILINENLNECCKMTLRASDIVPISEARARLTELAEDVVGSGTEKVLTKNGASYVAIVDARRLDYYHALEAEHANLVLADDAVTGLKQALSGQFVSDDELNEALGVTPLR